MSPKIKRWIGFILCWIIMALFLFSFYDNMINTKKIIDSKVLFCEQKNGTYRGNYSCGYHCYYDSCLIRKGETIIRYEIIVVNNTLELVER